MPASNFPLETLPGSSVAISSPDVLHSLERQPALTSTLHRAQLRLLHTCRLIGTDVVGTWTYVSGPQSVCRAKPTAKQTQCHKSFPIGVAKIAPELGPRHPDKSTSCQRGLNFPIRLLPSAIRPPRPFASAHRLGFHCHPSPLSPSCRFANLAPGYEPHFRQTQPQRKPPGYRGHL
jgi:hypothetical protein